MPCVAFSKILRYFCSARRSASMVFSYFRSRLLFPWLFDDAFWRFMMCREVWYALAAFGMPDEKKGRRRCRKRVATANFKSLVPQHRCAFHAKLMYACGILMLVSARKPPTQVASSPTL